MTKNRKLWLIIEILGLKITNFLSILIKISLAMFQFFLTNLKAADQN